MAVNFQLLDGNEFRLNLFRSNYAILGLPVSSVASHSVDRLWEHRLTLHRRFWVTGNTIEHLTCGLLVLSFTSGKFDSCFCPGTSWIST